MFDAIFFQTFETLNVFKEYKSTSKSKDILQLKISLVDQCVIDRLRLLIQRVKPSLKLKDYNITEMRVVAACLSARVLTISRPHNQTDN